MNDFDYYKPSSLKEALELKGKYGERAKILAGGSDLVIALKDEVLSPEVIIDLKGIGELKNIEEKGNSVE
ncbi:MAG: FAD binding domain-containing protein, partial [Spirochaetes bacterium]|nr:FAD binding domain-containing protein [Spirochaetota bacterium]